MEKTQIQGRADEQKDGSWAARCIFTTPPLTHAGFAKAEDAAAWLEGQGCHVMAFYMRTPHMRVHVVDKGKKAA